MKNNQIARNIIAHLFWRMKAAKRYYLKFQKNNADKIEEPILKALSIQYSEQYTADYNTFQSAYSLFQQLQAKELITYLHTLSLKEE